MMRTLKSGLTIGMLVAALAMTGGCGGNDNSGNGNDNGNGGTPTPRRTATPASQTSTPSGPTSTAAAATVTPVPTSTPHGGEVQTVNFQLTSAAGIQGFGIQVLYPTTKGSFSGSADTTGCTIAPDPGIFLPNDNDNGTLKLVGAKAVGALTFPIAIACTFDATSPITTSDLTVTVENVTNSSDGKPGDTSTLSVAVSIP